MSFSDWADAPNADVLRRIVVVSPHFDLDPADRATPGHVATLLHWRVARPPAGWEALTELPG